MRISRNPCGVISTTGPLASAVIQHNPAMLTPVKVRISPTAAVPSATHHGADASCQHATPMAARPTSTSNVQNTA